MNEWTNASRKPQYSYFEFQISHHLPAGTVHGAALDALRRGLVGRDELFTIDAALAPFGGLPAVAEKNDWGCSRRKAARGF